MNIVKHKIFSTFSKKKEAEAEDAPSPYFRPGETISESGQYRVFHSGHRLSHDVTLLKGENFPVCSECGPNVHFELIQSNPQINADRNFQPMRLYEIPHPHEDDL